MTRTQKLATTAEWAHVAEYGHGPKHARDRWCITRLLNAGEITSSQADAASRYARLLERSQGQIAAGRLAIIDGGGADPHARLFDASISAREAECALAYVRTNLAADGSAYTPIRLAILDVALDFPHRTYAQAMRDVGFSWGSKERARFVSHLIAGLDLLALYFDATDAQADRERRRGNFLRVDS